MKSRSSNEFVMNRKNDQFRMAEVQEEFGESSVKKIKAVAIDFGWALVCQGMDENDKAVGDRKRVHLRKQF